MVFVKDDPRINREGRPPGTISILTDIKIKLRKVAEENPEEYQKLIDYYWQDEKMRDLLIRMIDGQPKQQTDITSGGEKITPIFSGLSINGLPTDDSNKEDI